MGASVIGSQRQEHSTGVSGNRRGRKRAKNRPRNQRGRRACLPTNSTSPREGSLPMIPIAPEKGIHRWTCRKLAYWDQAGRAESMAEDSAGGQGILGLPLVIVPGGASVSSAAMASKGRVFRPQRAPAASGAMAPLQLPRTSRGSGRVARSGAGNAPHLVVGASAISDWCPSIVGAWDAHDPTHDGASAWANCMN